MNLIIGISFIFYFFSLNFQLFNEYTSRKLYNEWNPFDGVMKNKMFLLVSIASLGLQIFLIQVGGDFVKTSPLTLYQWLITIALGFISVPIGMLMRLIPVNEDPDSFFTVDSVVNHNFDNKSEVMNCFEIMDDIVIESDNSTQSSKRNSKSDVLNNDESNGNNKSIGKGKGKGKDDYDQLLLETLRNNARITEEKSSGDERSRRTDFV